jgi:hypothetical protein
VQANPPAAESSDANSVTVAVICDFHAIDRRGLINLKVVAIPVNQKN